MKKEKCPICDGAKYIIIKGQQKYDVLIECPFCKNGLVDIKEEKNED